MAGNWIEVSECVELLRGALPEGSDHLRTLSLILAGWMIHLGGKAETPEIGYQLAEGALSDGKALGVFMAMVEAQGGDAGVFDDLKAFHKPGATTILHAPRSGFIAAMDTTELGWAVQRLGAGREKACDPVDPHAGIEFHARRGSYVECGQPLATLYATHAALLAEPVEQVQRAIAIAETAPEPVPLVSAVFTLEKAEAALRNAVR
jgi:pyrimidine-nucleoside phosphorylase